MLRLMGEEIPAVDWGTTHYQQIELAGLEPDESSANIVRLSGDRGAQDNCHNSQPSSKFILDISW